MLRKLMAASRGRTMISLGIGVAALLAISTSSASAVTVHNPGMFHLSGHTWDMTGHHPLLGEGVLLYECDNSWEVDVSAAGHLNVHNVDIDPPGSSNCAARNDCDDTGFEGQITTTTSMHLNMCEEGLGADLTLEVTCNVGTTAELHCNDSEAEEEVNAPLPLEFDGELTLDQAIEIE